jgi:hypothetical protein
MSRQQKKGNIILEGEENITSLGRKKKGGEWNKVGKRK